MALSRPASIFDEVHPVVDTGLVYTTPICSRRVIGIAFPGDGDVSKQHSVILRGVRRGNGTFDTDNEELVKAVASVSNRLNNFLEGARSRGALSFAVTGGVIYSNGDARLVNAPSFTRNITTRDKKVHKISAGIQELNNPAAASGDQGAPLKIYQIRITVNNRPCLPVTIDATWTHGFPDDTCTNKVACPEPRDVAPAPAPAPPEQGRANLLPVDPEWLEQERARELLAGWNDALMPEPAPTDGKGGASQGVSKAKAMPAPKGAVGKKPVEKKKSKPEPEPEPEPESEPESDDGPVYRTWARESERALERQRESEPEPKDDSGMLSWDNADPDEPDHFYTLGADEDGRPGGPYYADGTPVPMERRRDPYADHNYDPNSFQSLSASD